MSDTLKRAAAMLLAEANAIEDCHTRGDGDWTGEDEANGGAVCRVTANAAVKPRSEAESA